MGSRQIKRPSGAPESERGEPEVIVVERVAKTILNTHSAQAVIQILDELRRVFPPTDSVCIDPEVWR